MRIADSSLESIRQRIDIVDLVREYVPSLRQAGRSHKARCPFHQERTPSFIVNPERQIFHCFGCQEGGDIFTFVMKMENMSFVEAVEKLGQRAGVQVTPTADQLGPREREMLRLREALGFAREFYSGVLHKSPEADEARKYLKQRGVTSEAAKAFGLGFALQNWTAFVDAATRQGFEEPLLVKAGLARQKEGRGHCDYFFNRIVYPIISTRGETIGFGARAMGDAQPKYLNSPETPLFSKGRVLYGLYEGLTEVRKARRVVLLEGYMDVIACHQFGFKLASAPLGTAVTPDHAALIKRYADEAVFVFDPDNAGAAAALRGAELLLEQGLNVRIATVPDALDPDELLHRDGAGAMETVLGRAVDLPDFQTDRVLERLGPNVGPMEKAKAAQEVLATIAKAPDEVVKAEWVRRLAQRLQADEASLRAQLARGVGAAPRPLPQRQSHSKPAAPALSAEDRDLLSNLLRSPALAAEPGLVNPEDIASATGRRLFDTLKRVAPRAGAPGWETELCSELAAEDSALVRSMLVGGLLSIDPRAEVERIVFNRRLIKRYRELAQLAAEPSWATTDPAIKAEYVKLEAEVGRRGLLKYLKQPGGVTVGDQ